MTILKTDRLTLRPFELDDAAALFAVYGNAKAMRYWSTLPHQSVDETERMIRGTIAADPGTHLELAIVFEGKVIGKVGLWSMPEIGYILHPGYWRRGLATEAVNAVITHGFEVLGLAQITADVDPDNHGSLQMLAKLGFHETGREKNTLHIGGKWFDSVYLALPNPGMTGPDNSV